jgi:hypothetical protein
MNRVTFRSLLLKDPERRTFNMLDVYTCFGKICCLHLHVKKHFLSSDGKKWNIWKFPYNAFDRRTVADWLRASIEVPSLAIPPPILSDILLWRRNSVNIRNVDIRSTLYDITIRRWHTHSHYGVSQQGGAFKGRIFWYFNNWSLSLWTLLNMQAVAICYDVFHWMLEWLDGRSSGTSKGMSEATLPYINSHEVGYKLTIPRQWINKSPLSGSWSMSFARSRKNI